MAGHVPGRPRVLLLVVAAAAAGACAPPGDERDDVGGAEDGTAGGEDSGDGAACPPGRTSCAGTCVDTTTDPGNCGTCGHTCDPADVCNEGSCASTCGSGLSRCGGDCIDPATDRANCGTCGHACPDAPNADGLCELATCILVCRPGWQDRDGIPGCEYACEGVGVPESCNGADDDCDGATDEDFACAAGRSTTCTTTCGTVGSGACTVSCSPPSGSACSPPPESCNGRDDDCDTEPDDGFACTPGETGSCATSCGSAGTRACSDSCIWGACGPGVEACNGVDDDCDTTVDDGFACPAGSSASCTTSCGSAGTHVCSPACTWGTCSPPAETCNGGDDDCDTTADDGYSCAAGADRSCSTPCGISGTQTCSASCEWGACVLPAEACNGRDDDCDGSTDEGFDCVRGASGPCTASCGTTGSRTCGGSCSWGSCSPPAESCNRVDDDCDTATDDGLLAVASRTSYGALATYHEGCDGVTQSYGAHCFAAVHRLCARDGCHTSGFGPFDPAFGSVGVTCVLTAPVEHVAYATLAAYHAPCDGTTQRIGPDCSAAVKRYCADHGYVSGFGPVENSGDEMTLACVRSATSAEVESSYTVLSGYHGSCNGTTERWGASCATAIHLFCQASGYVSGFGPVENTGDRAWVVCVRG